MSGDEDIWPRVQDSYSTEWVIQSFSRLPMYNIRPEGVYRGTPEVVEDTSLPVGSAITRSSDPSLPLICTPPPTFRTAMFLMSSGR